MAGAGGLRISTTIPGGTILVDVGFDHTEFLDLLANPANPGETDTAVVIGTDLGDRFEVYLGAEGTDADPVLQLLQSGTSAPLLSMRDYDNFGTLGIEGRDGPDLFNVYVAPSGPGTGHRDVSIDGGAPTGGPPWQGDRLRLFSALPAAGNLVQHDLGQIRVDYGPLHQFTIDYLDIERAQVMNNFWALPASESTEETPSSGRPPTPDIMEGVLAPADAATLLDQAIHCVAWARETGVSAIGAEATRWAFSDRRSTRPHSPLQDISARRAAEKDMAIEGYVNLDRLVIDWPAM